MKKKKLDVDFYYKDLTHEEFKDLINKEYPIALRKNDLVDRIYERYPFIDKSQIALIVKAFFQVFRDSLLTGSIINFYELFFDVKLRVFIRKLRIGKLYPAVRMRSKLPIDIRKETK